MPGTISQPTLFQKPLAASPNVRLKSVHPLRRTQEEMIVLQISNVKAARELLQEDVILKGADESLIADSTRRIYAHTAPTAAALFALDAWFEDDQWNFQFWTRIFQRLMN
jgi:hypothetical protein